jgi:hypothetical protein
MTALALAWLSVLALLARLAPPQELALEGPTATFALSIAVAVDAGRPTRDDAWIAHQIDDANELFAPTHVRFRWTARRDLSAAHANLHTRADRDALAPLAQGSAIDVFVVASLEDVDEPGRYRKGVAWTSRPDGARFLVLSAEAPRTVLAHELGHFLGNGHTEIADNLMSYTRTGGPVALSAAQVERTNAFAARLLAAGRLTDVGPSLRVR